jgi:hypothetical protein
MREQGMSTRTIAEKLGISQPMVLKILRDHSGDNRLSPEDQPPGEGGETLPDGDGRFEPEAASA